MKDLESTSTLIHIAEAYWLDKGSTIAEGTCLDGRRFLPHVMIP